MLNTTAVVGSFESILNHPNQSTHSWFLPWQFARDVTNNHSMEAILAKYEGYWMLKTDELQQVFVIIREGSESWYMMYLDVKRWKVYALDVTRTDDTKLLREEVMTKL
ncbi:hypothetical protein PIB30_113761, partial [Stylosanthes scabra]|nr:hypothetical protein [Stylosanthes scabra]